MYRIISLFGGVAFLIILRPRIQKPLFEPYILYASLYCNGLKKIKFLALLKSANTKIANSEGYLHLIFFSRDPRSSVAPLALVLMGYTKLH